MLRRFTDTDADAEVLFELDSDPEVVRFVWQSGAPSAAAYRERIRTAWLPYSTPPARGVFAAREKATGHFVGWFVLRLAPDYKFACDT